MLLATAFSYALAAAPLPQEVETTSDPEVRVMNFNIRYFNRRDGINSWGLRRHTVTGCIQFHRPDIVGLCEVLEVQMHDIARSMPGFDHFGVGRDGRDGGERCVIFYDSSKFELLRESTFWLSRTPDRPSADWNARLRRICTWGEFRSKTDRRSFYVFNTHLDHQSHESRVESARLIAQKIHEIAGTHPVVLMGDFNSTELDAPYAVLTHGIAGENGQKRTQFALRDALTIADQPAYGPSGTISGFGNATKPCARIDFILVKNDVRVVRHGILSDNWDGRTPSDHRPVVADIVLHQRDDEHSLQMPFYWRFETDPERHGERQGFHEVGFDDSEWTYVKIGEPWESQGAPDFDGVGWYRRYVRIPASWRQRKIQLIAHGIADGCAIFVNGTRVIEFGGKAETWTERTTVVHLPNSVFRFGGDNLLAIAVRDYGGRGGLNGYPLMLRTDEHDVLQNAEQFRNRTLLELTEFAVTDDQSRAHRFPIAVPKMPHGHGWLRVAIGNGSDDSGDLGAHYRLEDGNGNVVRRSFSRDRGVDWFEYPVEDDSRWVLVVEDPDTVFEGRAPGNTGTVTATLKYEDSKPAPAAPGGASRRPRHVPEDAVHWNDSWYWFSTERMSFEDAQAQADGLDGRLVTISSREENEFVFSRLRGVTFLGMAREGNSYRPLDPKAKPFFLWNGGEPSRGHDERTVCISHINGRWHDRLGSEIHLVCIEWDRE